MDTIHVLKGKSKWYYRLEASNGQILATSQTYKGDGTEAGSRREAVERAETLHSRHPTFVLKVDPA